MNIFEALMLICFGASWPVSIWKTYKAKQTFNKYHFRINKMGVPSNFCSSCSHCTLLC